MVTRTLTVGTGFSSPTISQKEILPLISKANELVPIESTAEISNTPTSKWVVVTVHQGDFESEEE